MERNFLKFVWRRTKRDQIWIIAIALFSFPFYFALLETTKLIVNRPIQGVGYTPDTNQTVTFRLPDPTGLFGEDLFSGYITTRLEDLYLLSAAFLLLTVIGGAIKYYVNTYKGRLGEGMLRDFRLELVNRVLRFPPDRAAGVKPSEVSSMIKDEVEPMGGMIGDAFVTPVMSAGKALTGLAFILSQNVALGGIALGIILVQTALIPRLRRQLVRLARARQLAARKLAGRVGELVEGSREIDIDGVAAYERADIAGHLDRIFGIRYELYRRKFQIKFLNNFLSQLTPLFFYAVGGYFAIQGQLDIGQLVAVIAAYREMPTPIRELISWDQQRVDIQSRYTQVIEQFDAPDAPRDQRARPDEWSVEFNGPIELRGAVLASPHGPALEKTDLAIEPGDRVLISGEIDDVGEALTDVFTRRRPPLAGDVLVAGAPLSELTRSETARFFGCAGPAAVFPNRPILDCLLAGLRHNATDSVSGPQTDTEAELAAAKAAGDWIDYERLGLSGREGLEARALDLLKALELYDDALQLGLGARIPPGARPQLELDVLQARALMRFWLEEEQYLDLIEPYDRDHYAHEASIAVNLVFGAPKDGHNATARFMMRRSIRQVLTRYELLQPLLDLGWRAAEIMSERLAGNDGQQHPASRLFTPEDMPTFRPLLARSALGRPSSLSWSDQVDLLDVALRYIEPVDQLGLLDAELEDKILGVRFKLQWEQTAALRERFESFDLDTYNPHATLSENVLFGNIRHQDGAAKKGAQNVRELILDTLEKLGLYDTLAIAGLTRHVGTGGRALPMAQRQKIALAKAVLRAPKTLIVDRTLDGLDGREQARILSGLEAYWSGAGGRPTLIWVSRNPELAPHFDRLLTSTGGRLCEAQDAKRPQAAK